MTRWAGGAATGILLAAALAMGWRLVSQIRGLAAALRTLPPSPSSVLGTTLMANGVDQNGRIMDRMPPRTKRAVFFAMSGDTFPTGLAFWRSVERAAPPDTFFVGICADERCASLAPGAHADFPILAYAEVSGLRDVLQASRAGRFVITNDRAIIAAEPPLLPHAPSGVAAEIGAPR